MEICKAPTLNKDTHIMYIEMENVITPHFFFNADSVLHMLYL